MFFRRQISLIDLLLPPKQQKRPVIAFVHNNNNVYWKEKNNQVWWHVEIKELMKLAPCHFSAWCEAFYSGKKR